MMSSVFGKTFYDQRWSMGGFAIGLGILTFFILYLYPSVADAQEEIMEGLGESMLGSLAMVGSAEAFLSFQLFSFQPLYLAIFLIIETSSTVAGEERAKTFDILLTRPIERWRILVEKALAIFLGVVIITAATTIGAVAGAYAGRVDLNVYDLILSLINTLPFAFWVLCFGLFCSAVFRSRKTAALVATAIIVAGYMLNSLSEFVLSLATWSQISPMYYYGWGAPLLFGTRWDHIGILLGTGLVFFLLAIVAFQRREIVS